MANYKGKITYYDAAYAVDVAPLEASRIIVDDFNNEVAARGIKAHMDLVSTQVDHDEVNVGLICDPNTFGQVNKIFSDVILDVVHDYKVKSGRGARVNGTMTTSHLEIIPN